MASLDKTICVRPPVLSDGVAIDFTPNYHPSSPQSPPAPADVSAVDEELKNALKQVQAIIGYSFRNPSLLEEALTHSSFASQSSYQRLEFVGDAVLNLAFTNFVFLRNPSVGPGVLSVLRAANISTEKLARVAIRHDFYRYVRCSSQEINLMVNEFKEAVSKEKEDCGGLSYGGSTVKAPKVLADIVESIAAAIYVDCNFDLVEFWKVFRGILEPIVTAETENQQPVTYLYELCQKKGKTPVFKTWKNDSTIITNVYIDGELCGAGSSEQKHISKLNAARDTLQKLCHEEAGQIEVAKCSLSTSETCEDQTATRNVNGGVVINSNGYVSGGEKVDGSELRFQSPHSNNHWQKPVYSKHGRGVGGWQSSSLKVANVKWEGRGRRGGRRAGAFKYRGGREACSYGRDQGAWKYKHQVGRWPTSSMMQEDRIRPSNPNMVKVVSNESEIMKPIQ